MRDQDLHDALMAVEVDEPDPDFVASLGALIHDELAAAPGDRDKAHPGGYSRPLPGAGASNETPPRLRIVSAWDTCGTSIGCVVDVDVRGEPVLSQAGVVRLGDDAAWIRFEMTEP